MTTTTNTFAARLAAALDLQSAATPYVPDDNPFASMSVDDLGATVGMPALNMAAKTNSSSGLAYDLEAARFEAARKGRDVTAAKRQADARARAARKLEWDTIAARDFTPDPERMTQAWRVVFPLVPIVTRIANGKKRWAARFLGSVVDDVAQVVLERIAVLLAKQDKFELSVLITAADELGQQAERDGIPRDQMTREQRTERKQVGKARKWLMGMINNRVQGTLCDLYTEGRNLRWDNIDIITTVMASINGVGDDPLVNAHKASRVPGFLGTRFQAPDGIDQGLVAQAINAAITERGLDLLTEILLNADNRRSNGSVAWSKIAERVFLATPVNVANGPWLWDLVCKSTAEHARVDNARGEAAMLHARNLFAWLPGFIVQVVESFDFQFRSWSTANMGKALMSSDFERYTSEPSDVREPLAPALAFASVEQAVEALTRHLDVLTGGDLVNSLVHA